MKRAILLVVSAFAIAVVLGAGVFFVPGMLNPVVEYESSVTINSPREKVWEAFQDDDKTKEWIKGLKSMELVSGEPRQPGSKYKLVVDSEGEDVEMIETITEVKEPELFGFTMDAEPLIDNVKVTFTDNDGKTVMTQADSIRGKGLFWQALFYWLQSTFRQSTQEHLVRFKNLVEAEQEGR